MRYTVNSMELKGSSPKLIELVRRMHHDGSGGEKFHSTTAGGYLKDFVYGANDGIITTFAVVAGVAGADLSATVVLILGFANLFADGFSMAMSNYLGEKSSREFVEAERAKELWEIEHVPHEELAEVRKMYQVKGLQGEALEKVVQAITSDKQRWVDEMMIGEHGLVPDDGTSRPWKNAAVTFIAFVIAGLVPLLPYLLGRSPQDTFPWAIAATALILFLIGGLRTLITYRSFWKSGLEMLAVGMLAAGVAYAVGDILSRLV